LPVCLDKAQLLHYFAPKYGSILAKINPNISRQTINQIVDIQSLLKRVLEGDRFSLSQAITLIESSLAEDQRMAEEMVEHLRSLPGESFRIAVSGSPGAGKSTFIEAIGFHTISLGYKPAVLAIDPSSQSTGGSILGDKMRMEKLSLSKEAFIRPSPAGDFTGGTAKKTRESILLLEKAGFNPIFIETVGVGQTETAVHNMTDLFLLLVAPASGDDIQGIKKGIMEMADIIVINKMDGDMSAQANISLQHYANAIQMMHRQEKGEAPKIFGVSSVIPSGMEQLWEQIDDFFIKAVASGTFKNRRHLQELDWFEAEVRQNLFSFIMSYPDIYKTFLICKESVLKNERSAMNAAHIFFKKLGKNLLNEA